MMALDVVAILERAMDDAIMTNFAGLCCLVTGSVIADALRTIRKGPSLVRNAGRWVLRRQRQILAVDLPHKLGAKFNSLFKLLFGLAL